MILSRNFSSIVSDLVENWPFDQKLAIATAGVGGSIAELLNIPGSSRVVSDLRCFNDSSQTAAFIANGARGPHGFLGKVASHIATGGQCVNDTVARALARSVEIEHGRTLVNEICIGITGALTTTRHRRGDNRAFICVLNNGMLSSYKVTLPKIAESEDEYNGISNQEIIRYRQLESEVIACIALSIATGSHDILPTFDNDSYGVRLSKPDHDEVLYDNDSKPVIFATGLSTVGPISSTDAVGSLVDDNDNVSFTLDNAPTWYYSVTFDCLQSTYNVGDEVSLEAFYAKFEHTLETRYPNNSRIRNKIRDIFSVLTHEGYLKRLDVGVYEIVGFPAKPYMSSS